MKKVVDVRDMHTAIHSLYLVNRKPKTTLKLFKKLMSCLVYEEFAIWEEINKNTECLGEIDYRKITGDKLWKSGDLVSHNEYHDGDEHYLVIGSFDLY